MPRSLTCSSHTISGVAPGSAVASRYGFRERVEASAAAGYTGMCLHLRDYAHQRQAGTSDAEMRDLLTFNGMTDLSMEFFTDWFMDGDAVGAARVSEEMAIEAAVALGAHSINVGGDFLDRNIPFETMRERFVALCQRVGTHGVAIALEIVAWSNVRDVPTALKVIDGVPNAGLVIDSWHVFRGDVPLRDLATLPAGKVLCVQVNDGASDPIGPPAVDTLHRRLCGEGTFDLSGFIGALDAAGIDVPLSVEVISPELAALDLNTAARRSFDTTRAAFG